MDHLHLRGEYNMLSVLAPQRKGSSPLTWRILQLMDIVSGKGWDHLHLRGEYLFVIKKLWIRVGSSPLTWRIPSSAKVTLDLIRIISTYVENTRMRLVIFGYRYGSSPLTWRILKALSSFYDEVGIISTYVENTTSLELSKRLK